MRFKLVALFSLFFSLASFAQKELGNLPINNWDLFPMSYKAQQIKKAGNNNVIAYYRLDRSTEGFLLLTNKLKLVSDIKFKIFDLSLFSTSTSQFFSMPKFVYNEGDSSVFIFGRVENSRKNQDIVYNKYNVYSKKEVKTGVLRSMGSDKGNIDISDNEKFVCVREIETKGDFDDRKLDRHNYTVFNTNCEKLYSVQPTVNRKFEVEYKLMNDGSVFQAYRSDKKLQTYIFDLYTVTGKNSKSVTFTPNQKPSFDYYINELLEIPNKGYYALVCKKDGAELVGLVILKIDFEKGTASKITDFELNEDGLEAYYKKAPVANNMIKQKELKQKKGLSYLHVFDVIADSTGFYMDLGFYEERQMNSRSGRYMGSYYIAYGNIFTKFDINGKNKWLTPIMRESKTGSLKLHDGNGSKCRLSNGDTDIRLTIPHDKRVFFAKINKTTGVINIDKPIINSEDFYINNFDILWLNKDQVILPTFEGIHGMGEFDNINLRMFDFNK